MRINHQLDLFRSDSNEEIYLSNMRGLIRAVVANPSNTPIFLKWLTIDDNTKLHKDVLHTYYALAIAWLLTRNLDQEAENELREIVGKEQIDLVNATEQVTQAIKKDALENAKAEEINQRIQEYNSKLKLNEASYSFFSKVRITDHKIETALGIFALGAVLAGAMTLAMPHVAAACFIAAVVAVIAAVGLYFMSNEPVDPNPAIEEIISL